MFSSPSSSLDGMQSPPPPPPPTPPSSFDSMASQPLLDSSTLSAQANKDITNDPNNYPTNDPNNDPNKNASIIGGKNRKKSKRSKQTIRKNYKKSNRATKKQKVNINNADPDAQARSQGLAQALLQSQGQS
jgi:hypothetical protein